MIVEESCENVINVYIDGYVLTADRKKRQWAFGDGNNTDKRLEEEASRRGMTSDEFMEHYQHICNGIVGWDEGDWKFCYNVVAMEGSATQMLQDVFDQVEEMIAKGSAGQDRKKCELILKTYASRPMIRMNGMKIMKYIVSRENEKRRIVYQMDELEPYEIDALIPKQVLQNTVCRRS